MIDQEFDGPLFKVLSRNDSGQAQGHQAGIVIPVPLRPLFPELPPATAQQPAPHVPIKAVLVLDDRAPSSAVTSYQLQTWNLTRRGETRITGNLHDIRGPSQKGDLLLIERGRADPGQYRLTILRQGTPLFEAAMKRTGAKPSGLLAGGMPFVSAEQVETAVAEIENHTAAPFSPFENDAQLQSVSRRIARSKAFRRLVVAAYGNHCALCGGGVRTPGGASEIEAAHVIPRALKGSDDVRNGLALCRVHHWAFDNKLVGYAHNGTLRVVPAVAALSENAGLVALNGGVPSHPNDLALRVHPDAIAWAAAAFDQFWNEAP